MPMVALFARAWIEIAVLAVQPPAYRVALFARAWIEIVSLLRSHALKQSPSLRGRGLKYLFGCTECLPIRVALFARAWIEIAPYRQVATPPLVALFARAWIEISIIPHVVISAICRPLCEGVD